MRDIDRPALARAHACMRDIDRPNARSRARDRFRPARNFVGPSLLLLARRSA
jgi:hypothetical protein